MNIYEQLAEYCNGKIGQVVSTSTVKWEINKRFGTNPESVYPSDYCYNRTNEGISFDKHIFEYLGRGRYKILGEGYPYTGDIYHKSSNLKEEYVIGKWDNGKITMLNKK